MLVCFFPYMIFEAFILLASNFCCVLYPLCLSVKCHDVSNIHLMNENNQNSTWELQQHNIVTYNAAIKMVKHCIENFGIEFKLILHFLWPAVWFVKYLKMNFVIQTLQHKFYVTIKPWHCIINDMSVQWACFHIKYHRI